MGDEGFSVAVSLLHAIVVHEGMAVQLCTLVETFLHAIVHRREAAVLIQPVRIVIGHFASKSTPLRAFHQVQLLPPARLVVLHEPNV